MADALKNVRISVLKHFNTNLSGSSTVDWPGMDTDTKGLDEWLEPRILNGVPAPSRSGERNEAWQLSVNCYARTGQDSDGSQISTIHRPWELADDVRDVFHQATIDLQNWSADGDPVIGYLRFEEAAITEIPQQVEKTSLYQVNITVGFQLIL